MLYFLPFEDEQIPSYLFLLGCNFLFFQNQLPGSLVSGGDVFFYRLKHQPKDILGPGESKCTWTIYCFPIYGMFHFILYLTWEELLIPKYNYIMKFEKTESLIIILILMK